MTEKAAGEDDSDEPELPLSKKQRIEESVVKERKDSDCIYENNKDLILKEWEKKKPKIYVVKQLIDATCTMRREWIGKEFPSATAVLRRYPCLESGKIVSEI